jgi:PadR family transcriptional regulator, regulatory protein PadR
MPPRNEAPRLTSQSLKVLKLFVDAPSQPCSGAEIIKATELSSGTLYPILFRFEVYGLLQSKWEKGKPQALGRPRRKLYSITAPGLTIARNALTELGVPGLLRPAFGRS